MLRPDQARVVEDARRAYQGGGAVTVLRLQDADIGGAADAAACFLNQTKPPATSAAMIIIARMNRFTGAPVWFGRAGFARGLARIRWGVGWRFRADREPVGF